MEISGINLKLSLTQKQGNTREKYHKFIHCCYAEYEYE